MSLYPDNDPFSSSYDPSSPVFSPSFLSSSTSFFFSPPSLSSSSPIIPVNEPILPPPSTQSIYNFLIKKFVNSIIESSDITYIYQYTLNLRKVVLNLKTLNPTLTYGEFFNIDPTTPDYYKDFIAFLWECFHVACIDTQLNTSQLRRFIKLLIKKKAYLDIDINKLLVSTFKKILMNIVNCIEETTESSMHKLLINRWEITHMVFTNNVFTLDKSHNILMSCFTDARKKYIIQRYSQKFFKNACSSSKQQEDEYQNFLQFFDTYK